MRPQDIKCTPRVQTDVAIGDCEIVFNLEMSAVITLGFDKGEKITNDRLFGALRQNFNAWYEDAGFEFLLDEVQVLETSR